MTVISKTKRSLRLGEKWLRNLIPLALIEIKTRLGIPARLRTPARAILENAIIPYYASQDNATSVLFVGSDYYTKHYSRAFRKFEYWTIDPDPKKKRYGSRNHIVDSIEQLGAYFDSEYFDIIICNGVLGHGLNERESVERAFNICFDCLRPGGAFVLGWNDVPKFRLFPLDELQSIRKFAPYQFTPLGTWNYLTTITPYRHVYSFFTKPNDPRSSGAVHIFTFSDMQI